MNRYSELPEQPRYDFEHVPVGAQFELSESHLGALVSVGLRVDGMPLDQYKAWSLLRLNKKKEFDSCTGPHKVKCIFG